MSSWREEDPAARAWRLTCYALAVVFLYFFRIDLYMALAAVLGFLPALSGYFYASRPSPDSPFWVYPVLLIVALIILVIILPFLIPALILLWLAQHEDNPLHFVLDAGLVVLLGSFLHGVLFPLLWRCAAPLIAHTVGEFTYQRVNERVLGKRPRFTQPLYLSVAVLCLLLGIVRLVGPAVKAGGQAWRQAVERELHPPTPVPPVWPKRFTVPAKTTVRTGIILTDKSQEIFLWRTTHVFLSIGDGPRFFFRRNTNSKDTPWFSVVRTGEILLHGADEESVVTIGEPRPPFRTWLAPGDSLRVPVWIEAGAMIWYCGSGDLTFRNGKGAWQPLGSRLPCEVGYGYIGHSLSEGAKAVNSGVLEVKNGKDIGWFKYLGFWPKEHRLRLPAGRVVDSGVAVRPGDRVRVAAHDEALYFLSQDSGELLIPPQHYREEAISQQGTIKVKGGTVPGDATVTVVVRGPEWK